MEKIPAGRLAEKGMILATIVCDLTKFLENLGLLEEYFSFSKYGGDFRKDIEELKGSVIRSPWK